MEWLNYHHLLYFWTIAREGSVSAAAAKLRLAQPTISAQLRILEDHLGEKLFHRTGRRLTLTETGRVAFRYADEIFGLGRELMDTLKGRPTRRPLRLVVGVTDALPKLIAYRLLRPALELPEAIHLVCREDRADRLLAELAVNALDLVLSDTPIGPTTRVRAFNHLLGECGVTFFAAPRLATYRRGFPRSLDNAPMLLPTDNTALRRSLDRWLDAQRIRPRIISEFEDDALLKAFGLEGAGIFAGPSVIEREIKRQYGVRTVGRTDAVRERFYAISVERRINNPAVIAICAAAREELFG